MPNLLEIQLEYRIKVVARTLIFFMEEENYIGSSTHNYHTVKIVSLRWFPKLFQDKSFFFYPCRTCDVLSSSKGVSQIGLSTLDLARLSYPFQKNFPDSISAVFSLPILLFRFVEIVDNGIQPTQMQGLAYNGQ